MQLDGFFSWVLWGDDCLANESPSPTPLLQFLSHSGARKVFNGKSSLPHVGSSQKHIWAGFCAVEEGGFLIPDYLVQTVDKLSHLFRLQNADDFADAFSR